MARISDRSDDFRAFGPVSGLVSGSNGAEYAITTDGNGVVSCTCISWKYDKKPIEDRICKHIKGVFSGAIKLRPFGSDTNMTGSNGSLPRGTITRQFNQRTRTGQPADLNARVCVCGHTAGWHLAGSCNGTGAQLDPEYRIPADEKCLCAGFVDVEKAPARPPETKKKPKRRILDDL